jgi:protein-S-isoprenylcysteine O-methyltransferase Ste14
VSTIPRGLAVGVPIAVAWWQLAGASRTFTPAGTRRSPLAALISVAYVALFFGAWIEPLNAVLVGAGWLGSAAGLALFEWARRTARGQFFSYIFSNDTPTFLCTEGPFAYIRNPFYTSYLLVMASAAVMRPTFFRGLVVLGMVIYFLSAALYEERKFNASEIAAEYGAYKQRTGRFLPKLRVIAR